MDKPTKQTLDYIGTFLRYITPIGIALLGVLYSQQQEIQLERYNNILSKVSENQAHLNSIGGDMSEATHELVKRGEQIKNIESGIARNATNISDLTKRIRAVESKLNYSGP